MNRFSFATDNDGFMMRTSHTTQACSYRTAPWSGQVRTVVDVAAEELLRGFVDGGPTPEQNICVISFALNDAAAFVPKVVAQLRELVKHDLTPVVVSKGEMEYTVKGLRCVLYVGTIDSVFRGLLREFVRG